MQKVAITLVVGIAIGAVGSRFLDPSLQEEALTRALPSESISYVVESKPDELSLQRSAQHEIDTQRPADVEEESVQDAKASAEILASNIPAIYVDVIGEPRRRILRAADRHAIFLTESRDEVWASAMESGIRNYAADNASNFEVVLEYVECRSEHCEIAGYTPRDGDHDVEQLKNGLRNAGWWLGGRSAATTSQTIDGVDRFVIIFNRDAVWESQ